jgi:hypothetical protein
MINDPPLSSVQVIALVIAGRHVPRSPDILIILSQAEYGNKRNNRQWRAFHCHSKTRAQPSWEYQSFETHRPTHKTFKAL